MTTSFIDETSAPELINPELINPELINPDLKAIDPFSETVTEMLASSPDEAFSKKALDIKPSERKFQVISPFTPSGDQPDAINRLEELLKEGDQHVVLRGATGTGKSATTAWLIERLNRPTLVLVHNKTLAAQLATELRELLPENAVEYFVSHFSFYQPEAYVVQSDTFIEKDSAVDAEVERLRHSATMSLLTRRDAVVVASVSAIYGLGSPSEYLKRALPLKVGEELEMDDVLRRLVKMGYQRNDVAAARGTFRVKGDTLEVFPVYEDQAIRVEFFGDEIENLSVLHITTGEVLSKNDTAFIFPATHHLASDESTKAALDSIEKELEERLAEYEKTGQLLEAQRLKSRTLSDLEAIRETGSCKGIENYSRHFDGRLPGTAPHTLLDYFPEDFLVVMDESHVTVPQLGAMYEGDRSRKNTLVDHGFRLPSALDNRPLKFPELLERKGQTVYLSATPGKYELEKAEHDPVEQVVRPTGLLDPEIDVRPTEGQIDDLLEEVRKRSEKDERVLVTTLTKKMAERLTDYLVENGVKARYLHSDVSTVERIELLRQLRLGDYDVLVGINLLREGLDLPEVSLVAILDADKEGFLRSSTSLIQTIGRAARNIDGKVIMYADKETKAMKLSIEETNRRREKQKAYNLERGVDPKPLQKKISDIVAAARGENLAAAVEAVKDVARSTPVADLEALIAMLTERMSDAAANLRFEEAARLRDEVRVLTQEARQLKDLGV